MDREALRAAVHGVAKSQTWLSSFPTENHQKNAKRKVTEATDRIQGSYELLESQEITGVQEIPGNDHRTKKWV